MILSDAIVICLRELNLRYLFGVSGANIEHIHDSIFRLGDERFQTVMTKSEYGAAFMADARARTHHTLGVCCATSGGGMMNLAVGIAESFAHSVPVLALVGQPPLQQEGRGGFQDSSGLGATVNAKAMWQAISKYACKVESADHFWELFFSALTKPYVGRKGPSVMLLPRDVMDVDVGCVPEGFVESVLAAFESDIKAKVADDLMLTLWEQINAAEKPVMVFGSGIVRQQAVDEAIRFAVLSGIPVVSTLACPGVFPNQHEQYLGMIGVAGHPSAHHYIEYEADLIISVGSQLRSMTRATLEAALAEKPLWIIHDDVSELDQQLHPQHTIEMDCKKWLLKMLDLQAESPIFKAKRLPRPVTCFKPEKTEYSLVKKRHPSDYRSAEGDVLTQSSALKTLNRYLPSAGHILFDAGNCAAAAAHFLKMPLNVTNTIALGMGGMGYAIAGAIGAQLGEPNSKRTMVFCGDGAFMMAGLEIHTAVELQLPILWVVFNNSMHGMCVTRQHLYFNGRIEGNTYGDIGIARIASGFGKEDQIWTSRVSSSTELTTALNTYFQDFAHLPGVVELKIATEEMPPFKPFLGQDTPIETAWI